MKRTNALQDLLERMSGIYNDGERVDVDFDSGSYARPDGSVAVAVNIRSTLGRELSGPQELRVILNSLSHEIEHVRESDLEAKERIAEDYPQYGKVAGQVLNIVEDQYIDWSRCRRFKGMRKAQAFVVSELMQNDRRRPPLSRLDGDEQVLMEGLLQVAFMGTAKGLDRVDDDTRRFLAWARERMQDARREPDQEARIDIAKEITDAVIERFPDREQIDQDELEDLLDDMPTDDPPKGDPGPAPDEDGDGDAGGEGDDGDAGEPGDEGDDGEGGAGGDGDSEVTIDVDAVLDTYDPDDLLIVD